MTRRGFTIVELLIYMSLIASLLWVLGSILVSTLDVQTESQAISTVEADSRYLLTRLTYDLHRADNLISPAAAGESASDLVLTIAGQAYTYSVVDSKLQLTTAGNQIPLISFANEVTVFSTTRLQNPTGTPTVQVNLTINQGAESRSYQTTIGMRN